MSEQDMKGSAAPQGGRRKWLDATWGARLAAVVIAAGVVAVVFLHIQDRRERARFLIATPDSIPAQADLVSYALSRGQSGFSKYCASCHGLEGKGDPFKGIPNLIDNDFLYGSGRVSEIERIIMYGIRSGNSKGWDLASMPAFGRATPYKRYKVNSLTPQELDDIVTFIYSFQHEVDDIKKLERGRAVFRGYEKGTCWDCHANDALGDTAIGAPNLTDKIWLYGDGSRKWIYDSIAFGLEGYCPAWIDRLSLVQIRSIAVYLHALAKTPDLKTASAATAR
jgi:cytochrome c oxidase cbb3-type subunit III